MSTEEKSKPAEEAGKRKLSDLEEEDDADSMIDYEEDEDDSAEFDVSEEGDEDDDSLDSYTAEEEKKPMEPKSKYSKGRLTYNLLEDDDTTDKEKKPTTIITKKKESAATKAEASPIEWEYELPLSRHLEISPNRKFLVVGYEDNSVDLVRLDKPPGSPKKRLAGIAEELQKISFSANSEYLITVGKAGFCVWSTVGGGLIGKVSGLRCPFGQFDLSPNGKLLVSVNGDEADEDVFLWDTRSGMKIKLNDHHSVSPLDSVRFSGNGKTLIFTGEDRVQVIDVVHTIRDFVGDSKRKLALLSNAVTATKKFKPA